MDAGLREGMVCRLTRGSAEIGEVVLVEVRPAASTALIAGLAPKQSIRRGDIARAKGMSEVAKETGLSRESLYLSA